MTPSLLILYNVIVAIREFFTFFFILQETIEAKKEGVGKCVEKGCSIFIFFFFFSLFFSSFFFSHLLEQSRATLYVMLWHGTDTTMYQIDIQFFVFYLPLEKLANTQKKKKGSGKLVYCNIPFFFHCRKICMNFCKIVKFWRGFFFFKFYQ